MRSRGIVQGIDISRLTFSRAAEGEVELFGTFAVLIVVIVPYLVSLYAGDRQGVCDRVGGDYSVLERRVRRRLHIAVHMIRRCSRAAVYRLGHGVAEKRAVLVINRQIVKLHEADRRIVSIFRVLVKRLCLRI